MVSRALRGVVVALCLGCLLGSGGPPVKRWQGLTASGTITKQTEQHWQTPLLAAGSYRFNLTSTSGDADLYMRLHSVPTTLVFDCRPAKSAPDEGCLVHLTQPAVIHVMVRGYAPTSTFKLVGRAR